MSAMHKLAQSALYSRVELITPEIAKVWLANNTGNRKIRKSRVEVYALAMARGEWQITHQGIAFDTDGRLLDGQHRLEAIVQYGRPVEMMVTRNIPSDGFHIMDMGMTRSHADVLGIDSKIASVASALCNMRYNNTRRAVLTNEIAALMPICELYLAELPKSTCRFFASAYMRAAAVFRMDDGEPVEFVRKQYDALIKTNVDEMSTCSKSLLKQYVDHSIQLAGSAGVREIFVRGCMVFSVAHQHKVCRITSAQVDKTAEAVGAWVANIIIQNGARS